MSLNEPEREIIADVLSELLRAVQELDREATFRVINYAKADDLRVSIERLREGVR